MGVYVSTTFHGVHSTPIQTVLELLKTLEIDGVELGSTHVYQEDFLQVVLNSGIKNFLVHNYCPPAKNDLVINIASDDDVIRKASVDHIKKCLTFSKEVNSKLYTFHPGFLSDPLGVSSQTQKSNSLNYDFSFGKATSSYGKAIDRMNRSLEEIVDDALLKGVNIAIETEGSYRKSDILLMQKPEEYMALLKRFGSDIGFNVNLAHTSLAGKVFGFSFKDFLGVIKKQVKAVEVSHCDLIDDQHLPLQEKSYVFPLLKTLPCEVPFILEFRNATIDDLRKSIRLIRDAMKAENYQGMTKICEN